MCRLDQLRHLHWLRSDQQRSVAGITGDSDHPSSFPRSPDFVVPRGKAYPQDQAWLRSRWGEIFQTIRVLTVDIQSPRWLIDHGREAEGLRVLAKLHTHGDENDPWVRAEFNQVQESITYEHEHEAKSYVELFSSWPAFRRLFLCCALQASVQLTGVSAIQ